MTFLETGLEDATCLHLQALGYSAPTDIQKLVIPSALRGQDILATAQTGTGKTASFLLPFLSILSKSPAKHRLPRLLILEPTRELAYQVKEEAHRLFNLPQENVGVFVGGDSPVKQERALKRGIDVLVATPGRLLDLIEREKVLLSHVRYAVVDEADRMLDMGFLEDVNQILGALPQRQQTIMLSATMDGAIEKLAKRYMLNPKRYEAHRQNSTADTIQQYSISSSDSLRPQHLIHILQQELTDKPAIIFCNRKRDIDQIVQSLKKEGWLCEALHGDLHQNDRIAALGRLKKGETKILVATDVAARGLDVDSLNLVINWDVPGSPDDYIHRIGRSGRAGKKGKAFTFIVKADLSRWKSMDVSETVEKITMPKTKANDASEPKSKNTSKPNDKKLADKKLLGFGENTPAFFYLTWDK